MRGYNLYVQRAYFEIFVEYGARWEWLRLRNASTVEITQAEECCFCIIDLQQKEAILCHIFAMKSKRNAKSSNMTGTLKKSHGTVRDWSSPFGQVVRKSWRLGPISLKKREKKTGGEKKVGAKYFPRSSLCLHLQIFYPLSPSPKTKASAKLWIISLFSSSENRKTFNM